MALLEISLKISTQNKGRALIWLEYTERKFYFIYFKMWRIVFIRLDIFVVHFSSLLLSLVTKYLGLRFTNQVLTNLFYLKNDFENHMNIWHSLREISELLNQISIKPSVLKCKFWLIILAHYDL